MGNSIWVLVERAKLPPVDELAQAIESSGLPLMISRDWSWDSHAGWLPMAWQGIGSGCEVEIETLENDEIKAADDAGFPGMNSVVILTTDGWDSLQCGLCFGAILASIAQGCVSPDEGEYLAHSEVLAWAEKTVDEAESARRQEAEADAAREAAVADGDLEAKLLASLEVCNGQPAKFVKMLDHIGVVLPSGHCITGSNWKLHTDAQSLDNTRYRSVRTRQQECLEQYADALSPEHLDAGLETQDRYDEFDALEAELEIAGELDRRDAEAAFAEIESWPDGIVVTKAQWLPPHTIEVFFSGQNHPHLEYIGGSQLQTVSVTAPPLTFDIGEALKLV